MSLDIYLHSPETTPSNHCDSCTCTHHEEGFSTNITHNLTAMANEAGIYRAVWRPEEIGISKAKHMIPVLTEGLALMKADPERFKKFDSPNGWGTYEQFVPWLEEYLRECQQCPDYELMVSR